MIHFLQTAAWKAFQEKLGRTVITDHGKGWQYQAIVETGRGNTRLYTPYGPTVTSENGFIGALASLRANARAVDATFIRVEPTSGVSEKTLHELGFKRVSYNQLQPAHTQVIDLTPPKEEILAQMSQNSRNITRNYHKKGIEITTSHTPDDIHILTDLLKEVAVRNHIRTQSKRYLKTEAEALFPLNAATLYYATKDGKPIAASLVEDSDSVRYYMHAAADDAYRKLSAGTALVGQMVLDAKDKGLSLFDLYGIAPTDDPHHPWAGFTRFKKSFGGTPLTYLGAWDLPVKKLPYYVYRSYQSFRKFTR